MKVFTALQQASRTCPSGEPAGKSIPDAPGLAALLHFPQPILAFEQTTGGLLLWNSALEKLSGYDAQSFVDMNSCLKALCVDYEAPDPGADFFADLSPKRSKQFFMTCRSRSGARLSLETTIWDTPAQEEPTSDSNRTALFPPHCRIVQFSPIAMPVEHILTTGSQASTLERYQLWLDLALESLNKGMWTMHFSPGQPHYHSLVFTSPNALNMLGYSPEEIADNPLTWDKLTHPDDFPETLRRIREHVFEAKTDHYEAEFRVKTKDGRWQWLLSYGRVTRRDKQGRPLEAMGTHIDIDRIKRAEENLQKSEVRFRTLVENMPLGIMLVDKTGTVDYLNPRFSDIFGYRHERIANFDAWLDLAYPDNNARAKAANFLSTPEERSYMSSVACHNGENKYARMHIVELPFERRLLAYEDVSAEVRSEQALLSQEQELREKSQTLEDINTALRVVLNQKNSTQSELKSTLYINLRDLILPRLDELEAALKTGKQHISLSALRDNLRHMAELCCSDLTLEDINFTSRERQLAEMIKHDLSSKRIAAKLGLSESAVEFHRNNIRRKLGIAGKKVNLKTYLKAMP